eukprot:3897986-Rhodomonas_salina.1
MECARLGRGYTHTCRAAGCALYHGPTHDPGYPGTPGYEIGDKPLGTGAQYRFGIPVDKTIP